MVIAWNFVPDTEHSRIGDPILKIVMTPSLGLQDLMVEVDTLAHFLSFFIILVKNSLKEII